MIIGKFVDMRSITLDDAEFSYNIRMNEKFRAYVGQPAHTMEQQREFIKWQMQQPGDYYFVVLNKKAERIGLIGVYDIHGKMGEIGREVSYGNPLETMEAEILLNDFARDILKLDKVCCVVYLNNKKVMRMHKKNGFEPKAYIDRNGIACAYYEHELDYGNSKVRRLLNDIGE